MNLLSIINYFIFLCLYWVGTVAQESYRFVKFIDKDFSAGHITGNLKEYSFNGSNFLVQEYLGIPYAEAPVGELRFKYPVLKIRVSDTGTLNASRFGPACEQISDTTFEKENENIREAADMWNYKTEYGVSEDCLTLNIWTPNNSHQRKYPVMVWIYGGSYISGTSHLDVYSGHRFAALENVVLVSFNYRLGIFGFLFLNNFEAPGNMALYDQLLALQWVKENIGAFGGDSERITLFGESAGSASVGFHMISPLSHHLFTNGIMQSASPTAPWALMSREEMLFRSLLIAKRLSCYDSSVTDYVDVAICLRKVPVVQLFIAVGGLYSDFSGKNKNRWLDFPVAPIVDGRFIVMDPLYLLQHGWFKKSPLMIGSNRNEGSYFLLYFRPNFNVRSDNLLTKDEYEQSMDSVFNFYDESIRSTIKFIYRNWTDPNDGRQNRFAIDRATGESNFACPCNEFAEFYSREKQRVYMYYLNHRSSTEGWPEWMGSIHGADCEWVFGKFLGRNNTEAEKLLTRKIMRYWANFARTGNPNRESKFKYEQEHWRRWEVNGQKTAVLDTSRFLTQGVGPSSKRCGFWNKLLPKLQRSIPCQFYYNLKKSGNLSGFRYQKANGDTNRLICLPQFIIASFLSKLTISDI